MLRVAHYLSPASCAQLESRGPFPVHGIVVGAMRFVAFSTMPRLALTVEFEANYAEDHREVRVGVYTKERWFLSRSPTARSRPPEKVRVFGCPTCGAPLDKVLGGSCQYCNRPVDQGEEDWVVESIEVLDIGERGPMLTGTVDEEGTELPTVEDRDLPHALARLRGKDPNFDVENLGARVIHIFQVMQKAWSSLQWEMVRPFLSDNLFEAQRYWIAAYRTQGLRNVTENANVTRLELVRITQDRWFDAVTVRIHAGGIDYTLRDSDGRVVGGDRSRTRRYTEYWTLIRGAGRKGQARADTACPSCGAPFEATMAAVCKHCHAKVNSGAFDWVLSRIEQDEVYEG